MKRSYRGCMREKWGKNIKCKNACIISPATNAIYLPKFSHILWAYYAECYKEINSTVLILFYNGKKKELQK